MLQQKKIIILALSCLFMLPLAGCGLGGGGDSSSSTSAKDDAPSGDAQAAKTQQSAAERLHPVVAVETSQGSFTVELDAEKAPGTVANFLDYVDSGYYNQTIVHQVYKNQGILGGGYDENYQEKQSRYAIRNEADNGLKNLRGTIAMVRVPDAIDSATSQFIVNVADNPELDFKDRTAAGYGYCVFGKVIDGVDVVDRIGSTPVHDKSEFECTPVEKIIITAIRRVR